MGTNLLYSSKLHRIRPGVNRVFAIGGSRFVNGGKSDAVVLILEARFFRTAEEKIVPAENLAENALLGE